MTGLWERLFESISFAWEQSKNCVLERKRRIARAGRTFASRGQSEPEFFCREWGCALGAIKLPGKKVVEQIVSPCITGGNTSFAIGVASPKTRPQSKCFYVGKIRNYKKRLTSLNAKTSFKIASITKVFTSALLTYYAVQDKKLWSKPLGAYHPPGMPALPPSFNKMTLLNLANYTSGLPQDNEDPFGTHTLPEYLPEPYTTLSMYSYLHDGNVAPSGTGSTFSYSNLAFALLSHTIPEAARKQGSPFAKLLKDRITNLLKELFQNKFSILV